MSALISISAGLAVGAVTDNVGVVTVLSGETIDVGIVPGIGRDLFVGIRPLPVVGVLRFVAQRLQALLGGRIHAGVQLVRSQRRHISIDLRARRGLPCRGPACPIILGSTSAANSAMITTTTIISISVTPACLRFRFLIGLPPATSQHH